MIWSTTGNLSNIRTNAKFPFGVAMLPAGRQRGTPTGGGNFYLFKPRTRQQRSGALQFPRWISSPGAPRNGDRHRVRRNPARCLGDDADAELMSPLFRQLRWRETSCSMPSRVIDARQPSA